LKKGRATRLAELAEEKRTLVIYESPHRIGKTLTQLSEAFGNERPAAVCRELTKLHEEIRRGSLKVLSEHYTQNAAKGELVIVVSGRS